MEGRRTFTPGIAKASAFIESEFKNIGLQYWKGLNSYKQEFFMVEAMNTKAVVKIDGQAIADSSIVISSFQPTASLSEKNTEVMNVAATDDFRKNIQKHWQVKRIYWYWLMLHLISLLKELKAEHKQNLNSPRTVLYLFSALPKQPISQLSLPIILIKTFK